MTMPLSPSAQKVQDALAGLGLLNQVIELPQTTRTAAEAAQAIGCTVAQIVKSLVFRTKQSKKPVLILASGANRVNEKKFAEYCSEPLERPDAEYVRSQTGFVIGGVAPVGHVSPLETYIDEDLMKFEEIWAAAGNPFAVFKLTPADLFKMTGGKVVSVK
ncbi:MAG: YbaK/EbsC family protein [Ignavibacteriales bacterium]|nr:YbaK/EbsC family protein [Ignavibacteriales bacterium]